MNSIVINQLNQDIKNDIKVAIATVTSSTGSAPGRTGNMMLIYPDGNIVGTCGGGKVEHTIIEKAIECLEKGIMDNFDIVLKDLGMSCGGHMKGFIDVQNNEKQLMIIGGGHIGNKIYNLGKELEFSMTIIDDRVEFANNEKFPNAQTLSGDISEIIENENLSNKYVVIVSKGHITDYQALKVAIKKDYKYLGLIGSKKKVKQLLSELHSDGIDYSQYPNFYAPVGLSIAKKDPAEIALGIMAEILLIKNGGTLTHMRLDR
ncbi:MAG: XdhC/CoxI family protein [Spirochaetaceae bacterium]